MSQDTLRIVCAVSELPISFRVALQKVGLGRKRKASVTLFPEGTEFEHTYPLWQDGWRNVPYRFNPQNGADIAQVPFPNYSWSRNEGFREKVTLGAETATMVFTEGGSRTHWPAFQVTFEAWESAKNALPENSERLGIRTIENGQTVSIERGKRPGYVDVRFPSKPSPGILASMKASGFRWSRFYGVWYGLESALPEFLSAEFERETEESAEEAQRAVDAQMGVDSEQ